MGNEVAQLLTRIDEREFEGVLSHFRDPGRTWFFTGEGRSGLVAAMVAMRFMHLGRDVHVQGESTSPAICQRDGMLVVSGSAETPVSLHYAAIAKSEGALVVVVTHEPNGSLAKLADALLTIPVRASFQLGGSLFEQGALISLDALALAIGGGSAESNARLRHLHSNLK